LTVGVAGVLVLAYRQLPANPELGAAGVKPADWTANLPSPDVRPETWATLRSSGQPMAPAVGGALSRRFRLAGTFLVGMAPVSVGGTNVVEDGGLRRAILDDLKAGSQHVVNQGEQLDDVTVVAISRDSVTLRDTQGEEQLWLNFTSPSGLGGLDGSKGNGTPVPDKGQRWGAKQMGEHRWQFSRDGLLGYYQELRDEPERIVKLFD